jgi:hypothetical protein
MGSGARFPGRRRAVSYLAGALASAAAGCVGLSPTYGVGVIRVGDREVYLKREARSVSYDVLVISANRSLRGMPATGRDHELPAGPLYYRVHEGALELYTAGSARPPLETGSFPVHIEHHAVQPLEWARMPERQRSLGLTLLEVALDPSLQLE